MRNSILISSFLISAISLASCVDSVRTTTYFDEISEEYTDTSMPINLELQDYVGPKSHAYLLLEKNRSKGESFIKIRWNLESKYRPNIAIQDSMKIMIDGKLTSFSPIRQSEILAINVEPRSVEEEAIYQINLDLLEALLKANDATIFISGQKLSIKSDLTSKSHKASLKNFLEHTIDPK